MQTQTGEPIPADARDADFLAQTGISAPRRRLENNAAVGRVAEQSLVSQAPISIYSTRMAEGVFKMTSSGPGKANPFAKNTAFTAPIGEGTKAHAEACDDASGAPAVDLGTFRSLHGAELTTVPLLRQICAQVAALHGVGGLNFLGELARRTAEARARNDGMGYAGYEGKYGLIVPEPERRPQGLDKSALAGVLRVLQLELPAAKLAQLFSYFDRDNSGLIDENELVFGLRESLGHASSAYRRALVAAAYDAMGGVMSVAAEDPAGLMKHLDRTGKATLSAEEFEDFFLNVSALCPLEQAFVYVLAKTCGDFGGGGVATVAEIRGAHAPEAPARFVVVTTDGRKTIETIPLDMAVAPGTELETAKACVEKATGKAVSDVRWLE